MRVAREGYPFIIAAVVVAVVAIYFDWKWLALIATVCALVFAGFFRDPERRVPQGADLILSPADGKVVAIQRAGEEGTRVSVFLSPIDVHINRSPIAGKVVESRYKQGKFHAAYKDKASLDNEQNSITLVNVQGNRVRVVQIAGVLARRIVCYVKEGDSVAAGERFGLIMFGSRVDLFVPPRSNIEISEGQRVRGGETIIGRLV